MLVLSRKNRETVVIDGRITVKVLQIKGNTIRLGIEAPRDMSIRRGELVGENEEEFACVSCVVEGLDKTAPPAGEIEIVSYTCAAS